MSAHCFIMKKVDFLLLSLIIFLALVCRLYNINTPLADLHSWRQSDTAAVARNFITQGFDLLHPKYDDLSNIQSGKYNPQGYRMVEFPIYSAIVAVLYKSFPVVPLEVYGRLTTIFFSLVLISVIYYLLLKESNRLSAVIGSLVYAIFPFFVFFSRVVLPDTAALSLAFLAIFFFYLFTHNKGAKIWIFYLLSLILFAASLLVKPVTIFFGLAFLYLFFIKYEFNLVKRLDTYVYFILAVLPLVWWRFYIQNYPEGIPANKWLFTMVNTSAGLQPIFLRPAFFRWIFFERINNIILGGFGATLLVIGSLIKNRRLLLFSILISSLIYLFTFEGGNVQHEYYQIIILPALAMFTGIGASYLLTDNKKQFIHQAVLYPVVVAIFAFSLLISFYQVKGYYDYSNDLVSIAKIVRTLTNPSDQIVTDTVGDTTLLYLSDRRGYPAVTEGLPDLKKRGASYFVTQKSDVIAQLKKEKRFTVIFENDKFALFKL